MTEKRQTLTVEGFPIELRARVKALAALRRITLRAAMEEAAEQWCEKQAGQPMTYETHESM